MKRLALSLLTAMALFGPSARASTIELVLAASDGTDRPWIRHLEETFIPAVDAALADTRITIVWKLHLGDGLVDMGSELDALSNGAAQVSPIPALPHSWMLYLHNISLATPFVCDRPGPVAAAIDRLHAAFPALQRAWASYGAIYLGGSFGLDRLVIASVRPVSSVDDLARKQVAADYLFADWFAGTQMLGLPGDQDTFRMGFETATTTAAIMPASLADRLAIEDLAPFVADPGLGSVWGGGLAADRSWFAEQRPLLRQALRDGARAYGAAMALEMARLDRESLENLADRGAVISTFAPGEQQKWAGAMRDLAADWAYEIDIRNMPGRSMLEIWMANLAASCGEPARAWRAPVLAD